MFKGTDTRTALEIADTIESVGGEMNAFTTHEQTVFYVRVPDVHLERAVDVLADVVVESGVSTRRRRVGTAA